MNQNRMMLRLALIAVAAVIFFSRGYQHNPQMVRGFGFALALALLVVVIRTVLEISKRKKLEPGTQITTGSGNAGLFTKPKDF